MPEKKQTRATKKLGGIEKCPTSIQGLDEITGGGLPRGRPTLVCGGAGSGKTLLAMEFLIRGSSILVSGTAGTGKTSLAAAFVDAACRRGERCLYLALEEAPAQIIRNMDSIGFDLGEWTQKGLLRFHGVRATLYGLEQHRCQ